MSIAVSATVKPSRILAYLLVFMLVVVNGNIAYIVYSFELDTTRFLLLVSAIGLASLLVLSRFFKKQHVKQLDISDSGDIILRVFTHEAADGESKVVTLTVKSTFWPQLLLLHLRSDDGHVHVVLILRDCVDADTFRKLSLALHWIAMHVSTKVTLNTNAPSGNF